MRRIRVASLRFLKQLNLFKSNSTEQTKIKHELITTRIYCILFPTLLIILIIYSAQKELYHTVQVNNPSVDIYQQLLLTYPDSLWCPCSQLSIPYSSFVTLIPHYHPVCSSDFISDRWLDSIYYDNASSYAPYDIRSVGYVQFQLLRILCQSSVQAIDDAFKATFRSTTLVTSRGILLNTEIVRIQVEEFAKRFIINIAGKQRRRRTLFSTFFDRNFLVSGLRTSSIATIENGSKLTMKRSIYPQNIDFYSTSDNFCTCDETYTCTGSLGMFHSLLEESNILNEADIYRVKQNLLEIVDGFRSGCLPINSLLLSSLECYYNQSCLNKIMPYLHTVNDSFAVLNQSNLNRFNSKTSIGTLADELMVEEWSNNMNYSQYFVECRPLSCFYTYKEPVSNIYIVTTLLGLIGGLIVILRIVCPQITNGFYLFQEYILWKEVNNSSVPSISKQHQPLKIKISQLLNKLRNIVLTLNLFERLNSEALEVRKQILATRFYIGSLFICVLILMSVTTLERRMKTNIESMPDVNKFEELSESRKLALSCPCSQIAIQHSEFINLIPTFHTVCSSDFITQDWFDLLSYRSLPASAYRYTDIRSYGVELFQTIFSLCALANETTIDAMTSFLNSNLVTSQVLSRQEFNEKTQSLISDFQLNLQNTFRQLLNLADKTLQGNQVLTNRISNAFFDGHFDSYGRLMDVNMYTGTMSSVNDSFPTCSCILNTCSQQLGIFSFDTEQNTEVFVAVPGMYSSCYPLNALRMSTLECWFNESCITSIWTSFVPLPVEPYFDSLNASILNRFSPTNSIDEIINDLMIDMWTDMTNYEKYYNICRPLTCTYTSYRRFDWLYTITMLTAILGGLSMFFRLVCPWIIKVYFYYRRKKTINTANEMVKVRVGSRFQRVHQVQHLISTFNVFNSRSLHEHIQRRERLSSRLYIISLIIAVIFLFVYMLFVENSHAVTVKSPSSNQIIQLKNYTTTLSCPCMKVSMFYSTFLSLKVIDYHPICSSSFLSRDYLEILLGDSLAIVFESNSFKRQYLVGQLVLLSSYCALSQRTVNDSISLFLRQQFITAQVLTVDQFEKQINESFTRFFLDLSLSLRHSLDYFQSTIHGNAIMSSYASNWQFIPSSNIYLSMISTTPVWYGNCSCASSKQCSVPMIIDDVIFEGLFLGCLPSSVLLQSTFECFYNQTCLDRFHQALFTNMNISTLPMSINISSHSPPNTSMGTLFEELFIEQWFYQYDYEAFFQTCQVSICTYTYNQRPDMLYVMTTMVGLIGGLHVVFYLICPVLITICTYLIDRIRKKRLTTSVSFVETTGDITVSQTQPFPSTQYWKKNRCKKIIRITSIIIVIFIIIAIGSSTHILLKRSPSNTSITTSTAQYLSSTMSVPIIPLCSARARWKRQAVTVAGLADGSNLSPLALLQLPHDIYFDSVDNMYIFDTGNNRILYWPQNSSEGRFVTGTGQYDFWRNYRNLPANLIIRNDRIYVIDLDNTRLQSYSLTASNGLSTNITILDSFLLGGTPFYVAGFALDRKRDLFYLYNYMVDHLLILNIAEDSVQIMVETPLFLMDNVTQITATQVIIDETADCFYVSDQRLYSVVKFQIGSTTGRIIAGGWPVSYYKTINLPMGLALDASGYLYIVDFHLHRIVQLRNEDGELRTIAGIGLHGNTPTRLSNPVTIKFDRYHNLYVADFFNHRIQRFDLLKNGC